jgi:hypothetical protein
VVQGQPKQIVHKTFISKITRVKMGWKYGLNVLQAQRLDFKPQTHQKKKKKERNEDPNTQGKVCGFVDCHAEL